MKTQKWLALTMAGALLLAILCGCAAKSDSTGQMYDMNTAEAAADAGLYKSESESSSQMTLPENRKLIRNISVNAETRTLDALLGGLDARINTLGGYVENRSVYHGSSYRGASRRNAELVIRIPVGQADAFLETVRKESNVVSVNENLVDVTLSYVATESRMKALQTEEARLLELIDMAESIGELLEIEARLTDVRSELENVTSQLRVYDNQIDYATIRLYVSEVVDLTVVEETVWQRMGSGFMNTLKGVGSFLVELAIFLVAGLPVLVPLGVIVLVIVLLVGRGEKKRRQRRQNQPPMDTERM